jgi:hypothetical protein
MGEWRYSSTILDLSFIPWLLYPLGNSSQYPTGRMGGWAPELDAMEKRKIFPLPGIKPWPSRPQPLAIPNELSRL